MDKHTREHCHECPWVITAPLIVLAIPSVIIGAIGIGPMLFGDYFADAIYVAAEHNVLSQIEYHGVIAFILHGLAGPATWLAASGVLVAWYIYMRKPVIAQQMAERFSALHKLLDNKYYLDDFNQVVFADGSRRIGAFLWKVGDIKIIDDGIVNGAARSVGRLAASIRHIQSGFLYHYAFAMILGLLLLLTWLFIR